MRVVKALVVSGASVVIVKQYRAALGKETYELPGGRVESGERSEAAIRRELREEIGVTPISITMLGSYTPTDSTIVVDLYFTDQIEPTEGQQLEDHEQIQVLYCPLEELQHNLLTGKWPDQRVSMALTMARASNLLNSVTLS